MSKILYSLVLVGLVILAIEVLSFFSLNILGYSPKTTYVNIYTDSRPKVNQAVNRFDVGWANLRPHPYFGYVYSGNGNNHGFRASQDYPYVKKANNEFVIGLFGGSVAEQFHESSAFKSILVEGLKKKQKLFNKKIVVTNFSMGAYKQPQSFIAASIYAPYLDFVITIDGLNETSLRDKHQTSTFIPGKNVPFIYPNFYEEMFTLDKNNYLMIGQSFFLDNLTDYYTSFLLDSKILNKSSFFYLTWKTFKTVIGHFKNKSKFGSYKKMNPEKSFEIASASYKVDLWERFTKQQHMVLKMKKVPSVFFLQPNYHLKGSKPRAKEEVLNVYLEKTVDECFKMMAVRAEKLRKEGVYVFDLFNIYKGITEQIYTDSSHVNSKGNEIMAREILKKINQLPIFK